MLFIPRSRSPILSAAFILLIATCFQIAKGQAQEIADSENDPVKLFDRGQDAHGKGDYKTAIQFYEAAVKLKPEFPEAVPTSHGTAGDKSKSRSDRRI